MSLSVSCVYGLLECVFEMNVFKLTTFSSFGAGSSIWGIRFISIKSESSCFYCSVLPSSCFFSSSCGLGYYFEDAILTSNDSLLLTNPCALLDIVPKSGLNYLLYPDEVVTLIIFFILNLLEFWPLDLESISIGEISSMITSVSLKRSGDSFGFLAKRFSWEFYLTSFVDFRLFISSMLWALFIEEWPTTFNTFDFGGS